MTHALGGFIQQHQLGVHGQGGGNFQGTLAAIGQIDRHCLGKVGQIHLGQQRHGLVIELIQRGVTAPKKIGSAELALQSDAHVVQHRHLWEHG